MRRKIFHLNMMLLMYLVNLTVADGQLSADRLPDGVIERFNPGASVYTVAFSPDGELLASGGDDNAVILWNVAGRSERESFIEHGKSVMSITFSPNGRLLASASLDGYVRLWHISSERSRTSLRHGGWVESVAFSPDGKMLASGGGDQEGSVRLWNVLQSRSIATFSGHGALVESVAFSPDGKLLASASRDKTIKLWDVTDQRLHRTLAGHSSVVHAVAFSPDGNTLASSSRDNTIKLWAVSSGENFATFEIRNSLYVYAEALAFSPNGQFLASACVDYTVRLWNVVQRREVNVLVGHHGGVTSVAFSPNGGRLASGSRDRTVLIWDLSHFGIEPSPVDDITVKNEDLPYDQDTIPPEIVIRSPMERIVDATVRQVPVEVSVFDDGRIDEVQINDRGASVLENGVYTATIPLNQDKNEIRITATDAQGNVGTHQFVIEKPYYPILEDTAPPEIVIYSLDLRQAAGHFTLEGSIIDDGNIAEVWVNDVEAKFSEIGTFTATVPLSQDNNNIRITATDARGNMGTQFTLADTEGPEIRVDFPNVDVNTERGFQAQTAVDTESTDVLGRVTDPSGVSEVKVNDIQARVTGDRFDTRVQLNPGYNLIRVTATDLWGNQSFKEITVFRVDDEDNDEPYVREGKDYALLFAVDTYDYWPNLRYPIADAIGIGQDLENIYGFQVELIRNPTKTEVLRVLHKYARKEYTSEDQLLIFFAGHGDFNEVANMGSLVCQNTEVPENDRYRESYFSHSYFRDFIDGMSCEHIFLVMDTCYSGTFDRRIVMRGEGENVSKSLSPTDIERRWAYTTRWYLTSGANERVPDYSLFIREFLGALRSEGGHDDILTIEEILTRFKDLSDPTPCFGEFGRDAPGSDFLFIKRVEN